MTTNREEPNKPLDGPETISKEVEQPKNKIPVWLIWQLSGVIVVLISGSLGFIATSSLLKLPSAQSCPKIYWPLASASMRLYCAELEADKETLEGFLEAINLVEELPTDHPLRPEINSNVKLWTEEILAIAEEKFQSGNMNEAIATATKIPTKSSSHKLVEESINRWQEIWTKAEETYAQVKTQLGTGNWNKAFREAVRLTNIDNQYWATVKYQETIDIINSARQDSTIIEAAYKLKEQGKVDDLLKAIAELKKINPDSQVYQDAQDLIAQTKIKLADLVNELIKNKNWTKVTEVANVIGNELNLEEAKDWNQLAIAGTQASKGTVEGLEMAIAEAGKISSERPLYYEAQELINNWKLEIEDLAILEAARKLAESGSISDLTAAIKQAELISYFNPLYEDAQAQIKKWNTQIQIIEDSPLINQAKQLASSNDINNCSEAIAQASLIAPNRPLYTEAQNIVSKCRERIEVYQDKPFLDQAIALANNGNWQQAINSAQQINRGRVLYPQAQAKIKVWRQEIQGRDYLQQAYKTAEMQSPEALARAIATAQKIPTSSSFRTQGVKAINSWAEELLAIAITTSDSSVEEAIEIAKMVPSGTTAYYSARGQIDLWRRRMQPLLPLGESSDSQETNTQE